MIYPSHAKRDPDFSMPFPELASLNGSGVDIYIHKSAAVNQFGFSILL
jgi:hypothetical protein